jgi:hypothetical protein
MTSLEKQLTALREKNISNDSLHQGKPSLFFSSKEAAKIDIHDIYEASINGLQVLIQYDERFATYLNGILHQSSVTLQRKLKSKDENNVLDSEIKSLLELLSLFSLESATHKVLEYLIRRYRIHELNVDSLIKCMLPLHDTKIFARVLQISTISNTDWLFLNSVKQSGAPISRLHIVRVLIKNNSLLNVLIEMSKTSFNLSCTLKNKSNNNITQGADRIMSFTTACIIEMLEEKKINDNQLRLLFPFLLDGLTAEEKNIENNYNIKSSNSKSFSQWRCCCCMIISQISTKNTLAKPLLKVLISTLCKVYSSVKASIIQTLNTTISNSVQELVNTIIILAQSQSITFNSTALANIFINNDNKSEDNIMYNFLDEVSNLSEIYDTSSIIYSILIGLIMVTNSNKTSILNTLQISNILKKILFFSPSLMNNIVMKKVVDKLLSILFEKELSSSNVDKRNINEIFKELLRGIAQRNPEIFDHCFSNLQSNNSHNILDLIQINGESIEVDDKNIILKKLLGDTFFNVPYMLPSGNGDLSLLLSLKHYSTQIRVAALKKFSTSIDIDCDTTPDVFGLADAVFDSLTSQDIDVCLTVWDVEVVSRIAQHISSVALLDTIDNVLTYWRNTFYINSKISSKVICSIFICLSNPIIIEVLCKDCELFSKETQLNGRNWLFVHISTFTIGKFASITTDSSKSSDSSIKEYQLDIIKSAYNCASTKSIQKYIPFFKSITSSSTKSKKVDASINVSDNFCVLTGNCIADCFHKDMNNSVNIFKDIIQYLFVCITKNQKDLYNVVTSMQSLLFAACGKLIDDSKSSSSVIECIISLLCPLVLQSTIFDESVEIFSQFINICSSVKNIETIKNISNFTDIVNNTFTSIINRNNLGERVLIVLLSSKNTLLLSLVSKCLVTFFKDNSVYLLLQIAFSRPISQSKFLKLKSLGNMFETDSMNFIDCINASDKSNEQIYIPKAAIAGSIHCLIAYCESIIIQAKSNNFFNLNEADSTVFLLLTLLSITLCSDQKAIIRTAGLSLAKCLSNIDKKISFTFDKSIVKAHNPTVVELILLGNLLVSCSSAISLDSTSALVKLRTTIFNNDSDNIKLQSLLLWMSSIVGFNRPHVSHSIIAASTDISLNTTWEYLHTILTADCINQQHEDYEELCQVVFHCLSSLKVTNKNIQASIIEWMVFNISNNYESEAYSKQYHCYIELLKFLGEGGDELICDDKLKNDLFASLTNIQKQKFTFDKDLQQAIQSLTVHISTVNVMLHDGLLEFISAINLEESNNEDNEMVIMNEDSLTSGKSVIVQKLCILLEITQNILIKIQSSSNDDSIILSSLFDCLLGLLHILHQKNLQNILCIEYAKGLVIDIAVVTGKLCENDIITTNPGTSKNKTKKKAVVISNLDRLSFSNNNGYNSSFISSDIEIVLVIIGTSRNQVQLSGLKLFQCLITFNPDQISQAIKVLGNLLSSAVRGLSFLNEEINDGRASVIFEILNILSSVGKLTHNSAMSTEISTNSFYPQQIIQPFCFHFQSIATHKRNNLLFYAMDSLGPRALPSCTSTLLAHVFIAYEPIESNDLDLTNIENDNQGLILLSKSSNRKVKKALKTSRPEELFRLALDVSLKNNAEIQLKNLISSIKTCYKLLDYFNSSSEGSIDNDDVNDEEVNIDNLLNYCGKLVENREIHDSNMSSETDINTKKGSAAFLILLHLEYVKTILDNKLFHKTLESLTNNINLSETLQEFFLELSEQLLQLISFTKNNQQNRDINTDTELSINLGDSNNIKLTNAGICKSVWSWSLEILSSIQCLLDSPTFVSILQELLDHEDAGVRQKALHILGERLEEITITKRSNSNVETELLLDLTLRLHQTIQKSVLIFKGVNMNSKIIKSKTGSLNLSAEDSKPYINLIQTTLMCIDILARKMTAGQRWNKISIESLNEILSFSYVINDLLEHKNNVNIHPSVSCELLKLHGSVCLTIGTLCNVVGPHALTILATIMTSLLHALEFHKNILIDEDLLINNDETDENTRENTILISRSRILLLRSIIAAISSVVSSLSNFFHPFIQDTLLHTLLLIKSVNRSFSEGISLVHDIDRCLSVICSAVPPRLSIPAILQSTNTIYKIDHTIAKRFSSLVTEIFLQLDRNTIKGHIVDLTSICLISLDYRRSFGEVSKSSVDVDVSICEMVVEFCLKITETELKFFLNKLSSWKDLDIQNITDSSDSILDSNPIVMKYKSYSRATTFFHVLSSLSIKLKSLFLPLIVPYWQCAADALSEYVNIIKEMNVCSNKKNKKRKISQSEKTDLITTESNQSIVLELVERNQRILECIRSSCIYDNSKFLDEHRYNIILYPVVALLSMRESFQSDDVYMDYCESKIISCLTSMASCIASDKLWKPLNQKVLMLTRDKRKIVRLVALKTLHKLFIEVGEEYILLLPECLPFLSELMEDDSSDVAACTGEVVRYIEDLSGEKLDSYLQ